MPAHATLLEQIFYDRQRRVLSRYFSRVGSSADVEVRGDALCAVDLCAGRARIYPQDKFRIAPKRVRLSRSRYAATGPMRCACG